MNQGEAYGYLLDLPRFATQGEAAFRPGLERMRAMLEAMNSPQETYKIIHVAGTNGKGSTASMLGAIWTASGKRTGLHTSPHLLDVTERMRVDGVAASRQWLAAAVDEWKPLFDEYRPSFFEATVALSLLYFAREDVEWAVVEVGMGGCFDATNVVTPDLAVITHIGLDHTQWLGETLTEIAGEKAGIIKEGVPVCAGRLPSRARSVIQEIAADRQAPLHIVPDETIVTPSSGDDGVSWDIQTPAGVYRDLSMGVRGPHQQDNAAVAVRGAELLLPSGRQRDRAVREGLERVAELSGLRARFERVREEPPIIVDVAHNESSLAAVLEAAAALRSVGGRMFVVLGLMADKNLAAIARLLRGVEAGVWPVALEGDRALPVDVLRAQLEAEGVRTVEPGGNVATAIDWYEGEARTGDILLATGSHLVVSRVLREIDGRMRKTN
jgi:dihydrofolate synthase/folylpolyglutamate synthase